MSTPFTGDIIGSWLFVRSTKPNFSKGCIYHFDIAGKNHWEVDNEGKRILSSIKYRFTGNTLTLIFSTGTESTLTLTQEEDGSVKIPNAKGDYIWWMVRLNKPESYSIAFVDSTGTLNRLNTTEQGAAANP